MRVKHQFQHVSSPETDKIKFVTQISLKTTECHSLQSEFDTLASTLKQLTNQKEVAQKRLDDLDTQVIIHANYQ